MKASPEHKIFLTDKKLHHLLLQEYVDTVYKNIDVEVDWEYSGIGLYRIHVHHPKGGLPCVSLKWEGM